MGDLICIAYYFLLRVGEYTTTTKRKKQTRTRQFCRRDVVFFVQDATTDHLVMLPADATDDEILHAEAATLQISNQKNGHAVACVHHEALEGNPHTCPVRALGRRIVHIRKHTKSKEAFINAYWDSVGRGAVTDQQISFAVKYAAKML